ncbi:hypothetical protein D3C87_1648920 [compost metagenome]
MPQIDILDVAYALVEELVDLLELLQLAGLLLDGQQMLPIIDALLTFAQRSVQCLRPAADGGKVPIAQRIAQHHAGQQ